MFRNVKPASICKSEASVTMKNGGRAYLCVKWRTLISETGRLVELMDTITENNETSMKTQGIHAIIWVNVK